jgi:hypothetical protein
MMLLETSDTWTAVQLTVTFGAFTDVYSVATACSAYDVLAGLYAWSIDAARPWAGKSLEWLTSTRVTTTAGFKVDLAGSAVFTLACNATAQTLLGLPANSPGVTSVTSTTVAGSWAPGRLGRIAVNRNVRWLQGPGHASGLGACRPGIPGSASYRPDASAVGGALDMARLAAVLADASSPRRCWIRANLDTTWSQWALTTVERQANDGLLWTVTLGLLGEAV